MAEMSLAALRRLLPQALAQQRADMPLSDLDYYGGPAPQPQWSGVALPELMVDSRGPGNPRIGGGLNYGNFGLEGGYQRRDRYSPPEVDVRLSYGRKF